MGRVLGSRIRALPTSSSGIRCSVAHVAGALYLLALVALRSFLPRILRPLVAIEQRRWRSDGASSASSARNGSRELQRVARAMNELSVKLRDAIARNPCVPTASTSRRSRIR